MITLTTDKGTRRYCSTCREPLVTVYEKGKVLFVRCKNFYTDRRRMHDSELTYDSLAGLQAYAMKVLHPGLNL